MAAIQENLDASSLPEFFRERVREAIVRQKVKAPESVEYYLVNLLRMGMRVRDIYPAPTEGFREEPLAFLYGRAIQADQSSLRINLFKQLGDFSLFISGFFPASFTRQLVDIAYYIQMGENAYNHLSQELDRHSALFEIYHELARRFVAYVDILSEVSEKSSLKSDSDLLRLYEMWLKTGSDRAKQLLSQEGIVPIAGSTVKLQ